MSATVVAVIVCIIMVPVMIKWLFDRPYAATDAMIDRVRNDLKSEGKWCDQCDHAEHMCLCEQ